MQTDDGERYFLANYTPMLNAAGKVVKIMGISQETTEQSLAAKALQRLTSQLEDNLNYASRELHQNIAQLTYTPPNLIISNKKAAIGHLVAGIAHEINNPAGYVQSNIDVLKDYSDQFITYINLSRNPKCLEDAKQYFAEQNMDFILSDIKPLIDASLEGISRITRIVNDLENYAQLNTSKVELLVIDELIAQSLDLVANEISNKVEIITRLDATTPVYGSQQKLKQVIINLLVNACHAIEKQGSIWITTLVTNSEVQITIEDNGSGILPENLPYIFDPFLTTNPEATGLGLHVVRSIIDQHHGRISVGSTLGQGSKFIIRLPL